MSRRRTLAFAILGIWFSVLGWHVRREYFKPELARLEEGARALAPGSYFYAIRMGDATIGMASSRLDTVPDGFTFDDNIILDIPALDTVQRAVVMTRLSLTPTLALRDFRFRMESDIGSFGVSGVAADSVLELTVDAGGPARDERVVVGAGITFDPVVTLRLAAAGALKPGREAAVRIFDPSSLSAREVRVRVTATETIVVTDTVRLDATGRWMAQSLDTLQAWRVEQSHGGIVLASWVDDDGILVRAESPLGFTIERTAFELARQAWRDARGRPELAAGYGALIEGTAIASDVALDDIAAAARFEVRLGNVALSGFDLDGGRQRLRGDTLVVTREPESVLASPGYRLPYVGGGEPAAELGETPLIQARDARIIRQAEAIVAGSTDPAVAARRLNDWVYREVRKEIVPSVPSAVQVLEAKRGDCNEHTVLFVALARAIGLPARTAAGLVYVRGRFYFHAWPEVWLGGTWVALDPTLGQAPADASHLRFLVGGLARQIELIRLIGRLQLEVV